MCKNNFQKLLKLVRSATNQTNACWIRERLMLTVSFGNMCTWQYKNQA